MENQNLTLYDIAKQICATATPLDIIQINRLVRVVAEKIQSYKYVMLLCRERYDFTVFNTSTLSYENLVKELTAVLKNRGEILYIDNQSNGSWEIWIRDKKENRSYAYYLFDYTSAVIE